MWGLSAGARLSASSHLYYSPYIASIFSLCIENPDLVKYLSQLGFWGNLESIDFEALKAASVKDVKTVGIMMYGKGSQLKEFQNDDSLTLVKV